MNDDKNRHEANRPMDDREPQDEHLDSPLDWNEDSDDCIPEELTALEQADKLAEQPKPQPKEEGNVQGEPEAVEDVAATEPGNADTELSPPASAPAPLVNTAAGLPEVYTGPGKVQENLAQAEGLLADSGNFFLLHGALTMIQEDAKSALVVMRQASKHHVYAELDGLAKWLKLSRGEWVATHPPDRVCTGVLNARTHPHLRPINAVVRQPYYRPDGSLVTEPGYDRSTGIYADFDAGAFQIPHAPSTEEVKAALLTLSNILLEFPLPSEVDKSAALSALMTAAVRVSLEAAPLFHVRAHQAGTGKSYLCRLITALATSRPAKAAVYPGTDTECAKVLLAALKDSPEVVEFDNLTGDLLPHDALCSVLTAEFFTGRQLGHTEMKTVSTRSVFLSSGNNVGAIGDMSRRCLTINLNADCDQPATREFKNPTRHEDLLQSRAAAVSAVFTIIQGWIADGRPTMGVKPLASFGQWSSLCRLPLIWAGEADPAEAIFNAMTEDPERTLIGRVLVMLHDQFGSKGVKARDIVARAQDPAVSGSADLLEVLQEVTESNTVNKLRLGHWLRRHKGHVVSGLYLTKSDVTRNSALWMVVKT